MRWITEFPGAGRPVGAGSSGQAARSARNAWSGTGGVLRLLVLAAIAMTVAGPDARAGREPPCGPRRDVLAVLAERFKETPIGVGLANDGQAIELLISDTGATWTLLITTPKGASCILAAGEDWERNKALVLGGRGI